MKMYPRNKVPLNQVKRFIIVFFVIATLGYLLPFTSSVFLLLTPLALCLSAYLLMVYHVFKKGDVLVFVSIVVLGFVIEAIGVSTGVVFGRYQYGETMGLKVFDTPLLIGVNWLFLSYSGLSIASKIPFIKRLDVVVAPLIMLIYDVVLETVAPKTDMWTWDNQTIPMQNYLVWFLVGFCFVGLLKFARINTKNKVAPLLYICQLCFFVVLAVYFNWLK
jgi:uncharacterized membrane protein